MPVMKQSLAGALGSVANFGSRPNTGYQLPIVRMLNGIFRGK